MAVDWLKIKTDYLKNPETTIEQVAVKYGVNKSYCWYIASKEKWKDEKNAIHIKAEEKLRERLPETIAEVKLRHARAAKNIQAVALHTLVKDNLKPTSYESAVTAFVKGVNIERQALDMNQKDIQDELYKRFSQYTFIFNLSPDELSNFTRSALSRGGAAVGDIVPAPSQQHEEGTAEQGLGSVALPEGLNS